MSLAIGYNSNLGALPSRLSTSVDKKNTHFKWHALLFGMVPMSPKSCVWTLDMVNMQVKRVCIISGGSLL